MKKPFAFEAYGCKDSAIYGPVRAGGAHFIRIVSRLFATLAYLVILTDFATAAPQAGRPDLGTVTQAIERWFDAQDDYEPGDLITRSQVKTVLAKLADAGAAVPSSEKIAELALDDSSFIVRELSTTSGRKFMRNLAKDPGAFARLDRLTKVSGGEKLIRDLARDKGGDKLIEYMATKGGRSMMSDVPGATDFNKPTGRIYTVDDLIAAVESAWMTR
jgi:hypothetical protein